MKRNTEQQGFTLIELIVVIVILGILAATALPKFVDLKGDAANAAIKGAAGAIASASAINYGAAAAGNTGSQAITNSTNACSLAVNNLLQNAADFSTTTGPAFRYANAAAAGNCGAAGSTVTCGLTSNSDTSKTASATVVCTG